MTIRERDRALFDAISARYVRKDLAGASRVARAHRLRRTLDAVRPQLPPTRPAILELGCGAGFTADYLVGQFDRYVGVDHSAQLIDLARRHQTQPGVSFVCADLATLMPEPRYDLVLMVGVLHHLDDPAAALSSLSAWLRPGGVIVVNEPQGGNPLISAMRALRKRLDAAYSSDQREFTADELATLFRQAGLARVQLTAQGYLSTPLAEVVFEPAWLFAPLARLACRVDDWLERRAGRRLGHLAWNVVAAGQAPAA